AEMRIAIVVLPHRKLFRCMVDHQSKLHRFSPLAQLSLALPASIRMTDEKRSILQPSENLLRISTGVEDLRRSYWMTDHSESAGINRHVVGDERALQERKQRIHPGPASCRCD